MILILRWQNGLDEQGLVSESEIIDMYLTPKTERYWVGGGLYSFPAKQFLSNRKELCDWLVEAGRIMQDDEAVMSLYISKGEDVVDIHKEIRLDMLVKSKHTEECISHNVPFMNHLGRLDLEYLWRESFDSL